MVNIKEYVHDLKECLNECNQSFQEFSKNYRKNEFLHKKLHEECEHKEEQSRRNKVTTKVVGAIAVGGTLALSVVAGAFTFGVATVVGLAAAGAAAVATYLLAEKFEKSEKAFRVVGVKLGELTSATSNFGEHITGQFECFVTPTSIQTDSVNASVTTHDAAFCQELDILLKGIKRARLQLKPLPPI